MDITGLPLEGFPNAESGIKEEHRNDKLAEIVQYRRIAGVVPSIGRLDIPSAVRV